MWAIIKFLIFALIYVSIGLIILYIINRHFEDYDTNDDEDEEGGYASLGVTMTWPLIIIVIIVIGFNALCNRVSEFAAYNRSKRLSVKKPKIDEINDKQ